MDPWTDVEADRLAFADYLETLSPADWDTESLCAGWTVKGVTTHLLITPTLGKAQLAWKFLGAGFNLDRMSARLIDEMSPSMTNAQLIARTRETAGSHATPPGLKPLGVYAEVLTHTSDISLVVGKPLALPVEHYVIALDHYKGVQPVLGCKKRIEGLRLQATDTSWSTGDGPLVEGPAQLLLSAMAGRRAPLDQLSGAGVDVLRGR